MEKKKWYNWLYQPIAFLHLRYIQRKYKRLTLQAEGQQTNMYLAKLKLLQAKEEYYKTCFDAWGIFHPSCAVNEKHYRQMLRLFRKKDFKEICIVKWYSKDIVMYFRNMLYKHNIKTPIWNSSTCGPGTYDFNKLGLDGSSMEILQVVNSSINSLKKLKKNTTKNKTLTLLIALATCITFFGCASVSKERNEATSIQIPFKIYGIGVEVITIDSCEYIHIGEGANGMLSHKGNCKYCKQREIN